MPGHSDVVRRPTPAVVAAAAVGTLVALALAVAAVLVGLNLTPVAIYGTSMQPTIRPGDVVLLDRRAAPEPGTVVTYVDDTRWITHRVRAHAADGSLVLRGDANGWDDPPVSPDRAVGVTRLVVPALGMPVYWAHERRALPLIVVGASAVALTALTAVALADQRGRRPTSR